MLISSEVFLNYTNAAVRAPNLEILVIQPRRDVAIFLVRSGVVTHVGVTELRENAAWNTRVQDPRDVLLQLR